VLQLQRAGSKGIYEAQAGLDEGLAGHVRCSTRHLAATGSSVLQPPGVRRYHCCCALAMSSLSSLMSAAMAAAIRSVSSVSPSHDDTVLTSLASMIGGTV